MSEICCRFRLECGPPEGYEALLALAGFTLTNQGWSTPRWTREFPPVQGTVRSVDVLVYIDHLEFNLAPSIASHSPWEHSVGAFPAAVAVKIMAILAGWAGGAVIKQTSMMGDCPSRNGGKSTMVVGVPPEEPVALENMCPGFQDWLTGGIPIVIIDGQTQRMSEDYIGERPAPAVDNAGEDYNLYGG